MLKIFRRKTKEEKIIAEMKEMANSFIEEQMKELDKLTLKLLEENKKELEKALKMAK